ncbi:MAG: MCP four helix bundle domain-containing protein, partial [Sulfuricellaceae bacterium]|nr:MCP four helix bundle domain-containing protein [Sulfuricellaceae bacterium]
MIRIKTLKAKLLFASLLAILALLVLTLVDIYSVNKSTDALASVFENRVQPTAALQDIDDNLKEVRFRMAGFLLDQMPAVGSSNQLKDARASIPQEWNTFKEKTAGTQFSDDAKAQIEKIDANLATLPAFFDKLDKAYGAEEKPTVSSMLEDEWPSIQSGLLKPISQLLPQQRHA